MPELKAKMTEIGIFGALILGGHRLNFLIGPDLGGALPYLVLGGALPFFPHWSWEGHRLNFLRALY